MNHTHIHTLRHTHAPFLSIVYFFLITAVNKVAQINSVHVT